MKIKLSFFLAKRYLMAKWSLMSTLSILMIAFGLITLITVLSVMNGFHDTFRRKIIETNSYHLVLQPGPASDDLLYCKPVLIKNKEIVSIIPYYSGEGILRGDFVTRGLILKALPENVLVQDRGFAREIRVEEGEFDLSGNNTILLGVELAREAGIHSGDFVTLLTLRGGEASTKPQVNLFRVTGLFKTGYWEYDKNMAYISIDAAYKIFGIDEKNLSIGVKIQNIFKADRVASWIHRNVKDDYYLYTWMDLNRPLFEALHNEKVGIGFVVMLIIVSGAFNIIGSLVMTVMDKKREIGILRALGAQPSLIMRIFVIDGLIIGCIGTVIGVFIGFILTLNIEGIFNFFETVVNGIRNIVYYLYLYPLGHPPFPRFEILSNSIYYLEGVPVEIRFRDILIVSLFSLLLSVLAAYYPARKASMMKPAETIRYE